MGILYAVTRGRSRTTKIATILTALATIAGASIVYRYIQCVRHPVALSDFANAVVYVRTPFGMAMAFAIGISIALATLVIPRERFTRRWYAMLVVVGCAIGASVPLAFRPEVGYAPNARAFLRLTLIDPIAAISAGLILYGLINGGLPFITRIARSKFVAAVAALSYAIYLFHYPILEALDVHLLHGTYGAKVFVELGACVLVLILPIAIVTHRFVEQPFLTIKDRLRQRPAS
jgi:peptidoglycan/LPS O-acetylase OafA/YrhL